MSAEEQSEAAGKWDETDLSLFGKGKSKGQKHDKADASMHINSPSIERELWTAKDIISIATNEDTYQTNNRYVGKAVILNHKDVKGQKQRVGTEEDRDAMHQTLSLYGFDVRVYDDLTFAEISDMLKKTAEENFTDYDCFVLVVMSHGNEGKVYAKDMNYPVERLWNPFLGDKCITLVNKPKLFFIQACRGENLDKPVVFVSEFATMSSLPQPAKIAAPVTYAIPSTADMLVFYSTFDKHFSFRNVEVGSWFIQSLCSVLNQAAENDAKTNDGVELLRLLTAVNRKVAYEYQSNAKIKALDQMKEMPNFMSTLTKTFYLKVKSPFAGKMN